jgi:hypothetical protein
MRRCTRGFSTNTEVFGNRCILFRRTPWHLSAVPTANRERLPEPCRSLVRPIWHHFEPRQRHVLLSTLVRLRCWCVTLRCPVRMMAGSYVWDTNGAKYLDAGGGIAVNALGHAHPAIVRTLSEQGSKLMHVSNLYYHEPGARLAERITKLMGGGKVFFCNSGAEANEGMWKLARCARYPGVPCSARSCGRGGRSCSSWIRVVSGELATRVGSLR